MVPYYMIYTISHSKEKIRRSRSKNIH